MLSTCVLCYNLLVLKMPWALLAFMAKMQGSSQAAKLCLCSLVTHFPQTSAKSVFVEEKGKGSLGSFEVAQYGPINYLKKRS